MAEQICECDICKLSRRVKAAVETRNIDELIVLVSQLHEESYSFGEDLCFYRAVFDGSWPSSVEILYRHLGKAIARKYVEHG